MPLSGEGKERMVVMSLVLTRTRGDDGRRRISENGNGLMMAGMGGKNGAPKFKHLQVLPFAIVQEVLGNLSTRELFVVRCASRMLKYQAEFLMHRSVKRARVLREHRNILLTLSKLVPELESLTIEQENLDHGKGTKMMFQIVSLSFHTLKRINLDKCCLEPKNEVLAMFRSCRQLTEVSLRGQNSVDDSFLERLSRSCHSLERIDLSRCCNMTSQGLQALVTYHGPSLRSIRVETCVNTANDVGLGAIAANCPNLIELSVSSSRADVTQSGIQEIARNCRKLEYLDLYGCSGAATEAALKQVGSNLKFLRHLDISACSDEVTNDGLRSVVLGCKHLEWIGFDFCNKVHDSALDALGECEMLRHVSMVRCHKLSTHELARFLQRRRNSLEYINLSECEHVNDQVLEAFVGALCPLSSIHLCGCGNITNHGISSLSNSCPRLSEVMLSRCGGVTDLTMFILAERAKNTLSKVDVRYCANISEIGVVHLAETCQRLERIGITLGPAMSSKGLNRVRANLFY